MAAKKSVANKPTKEIKVTEVPVTSTETEAPSKPEDPKIAEAREYQKKLDEAKARAKVLTESTGINHVVRARGDRGNPVFAVVAGLAHE